jgi:hypothetical protein
MKVFEGSLRECYLRFSEGHQYLQSCSSLKAQQRGYWINILTGIIIWRSSSQEESLDCNNTFNLIESWSKLINFYDYSVYASIAFFFDLLKCRAQTSLDKQITYREEISRIILREGFKGFTLGYPAMVIRDIISFGFYFSIYDHSKSLLCPDQ